MLEALRNGEPFIDVGKDYPYLKEIKTLKQLGVVKGDPSGCFNPDYCITREEVMLVAYRIVKLL